jgi:transient receptor potential cation channel subfamily A member 1
VLTNSGETAIYLAVQSAASKTITAEKALQCVKLLTDHNCDIFARSNQGCEFTAVHLAAKYKLWELVKHFLKKQANIDLEINNTTARKLIEEYNPLLVHNYIGLEKNGDDDRKRLFDILEHRNEPVSKKEEAFHDFLENNPGFDLKVNAIYKGKHTLLECAVKNGLKKAAKQLIVDKDANPNYALFDAIEQGEEFVEILCKSNTPIDVNKKTNDSYYHTVLHKAVLLKKSSVNVVKRFLQMGEEQLENNFTQWVNSQDYRGYTALHYAAHRRLKDIEQVLLNSSPANIFLPDDLGVPAFYDMRPEVVEAYFDSQIQMTDKSVNDEGYGVIFDYNFLDTSKLIQKNQTKAVDLRKYLASVPIEVEDEELLNNDGIKNKEEENEFKREIGPLEMLASSPQHKHLVLHPIVTSFLHLKWKKLYWLYWLNFLFYLAFMVFLTLFMFSLAFANSFDNDERCRNLTNTSEIEKIKEMISDDTYDFVWWGTCILTVLMLCREVFQVVFLHNTYLKRLENYIEIFIIGATLLLLITPNQVILSAFLYLLAALEFIFLMGRHPRLATYIDMFTTVSLNFIKFFLWYVFLIFAFGLSFFITLNKSSGDCEKHFFESLPKSIFKTVIMMSGEYEAGEINFDHVPLASHIIFIAFLFLISIVMVNLLNGLAVSDTQEIRNMAEHKFYNTQINFFSDVESVCSMVYKLMGVTLLKRSLILNNCQATKKNILTVKLNDGNRTAPYVRWAGEIEVCYFSCIVRECPQYIKKTCNVYNKIVEKAVQIAKSSNAEEDKIDQLLKRFDLLEMFLKHKNDRRKSF